MAFGKKEAAALTGTLSVTNNSKTVTGTGTQFLTELKVGWVVNVGSQRFIVKSIASNTQFTAHEVSNTTASGLSATVTQLPTWVPDSKKMDVYGVDLTEAQVNKATPGWVYEKRFTGGVHQLVITNAGTGYDSAPTVTFSGGNPVTPASATAIVGTTGNERGKVIGFNIVPGEYTGNTPPTVSIAQKVYTFNSGTGVNSTNDTITLPNHAFVTGDAFVYSRNSGSQNIGLTDNTTYYVIVVDANTIKVATSRENALAGTAVDLTSGGNETHQVRGIQATATVKMQGKFGRRRRETLVSMAVPASEMGDREDVVFPDA